MKPATVAMPLPHAQAAAVGRTIVQALRRPTGCAHLSAGSVAMLCVQHPHTLRCGACQTRHVAGHAHAEEHTCDVCAGPLSVDADTGHVGMAQPILTDAVVRLGRGRSTQVRAVIVSGWGCCWSCAIDLQQAHHFGGAAC
jgi:hypothetical protein